MKRVKAAVRQTLVVDVGGTHVKVLATGHTAPIKIDVRTGR